MNPDSIHLTIMSAEAVVWTGNISSLTSENSEGVFDLLPDHARFMTLIEEKPILIRLEDGTERSFAYPKAVLFFQDNSAKIYVHMKE